MGKGTVTVAIPVRDGDRYLEEVLESVRNQRIDRPVEVLVVDSGSSDRSVDIARSSGVRLVQIPPGEFSHGGIRNRMMELSEGEHVAFLTQDATPATRHWLSNLLAGFELSPDVALVFGPYIARSDASHMVNRELREFFAGFSEDGEPSLQRLGPDADRGAGYRRQPGRLTFFTDANGCVARWAWDRVPYRDAPYAEDQLLAAEMIEAGFSKVFHPGAAVYHSHDYGPLTYLRRCFDEWRGLREVYGHVENAAPKRVARRLLDETRGDVEFLRDAGTPLSGRLWGGARSALHHTVRMIGAIAGSRADRLPPRLRSLLSLEGRPEFHAHPEPIVELRSER
jgi:glycosyltransferase involved in cell wall biosynthesis